MWKNKKSFDVYSSLCLVIVFLILFIIIFFIWKNNFYNWNVKLDIHRSQSTIVNLDFSKMRCKSLKYPSIVASDFLTCNFLLKGVESFPIKKTELWFNNYEKRIENSAKLITQCIKKTSYFNCRITGIPIKETGSTDYSFLIFLSDNPNYDYSTYILNEDVLSLNEYRFQKNVNNQILAGLLILVFSIPTGFKNLRDLIEKKK